VGFPVSGGLMSAWLYGKLPAHGDFVSRGLSMQQRDSLDNWLSHEMAQARQQLGDDFVDLYNAAPPWCFIENREESGWAGGAISPSVDSAGRHFPIIVARAQLAGEQAKAAAQACVDVIYDAFNKTMDVDAVYSAVSEIDPVSDATPGAAQWWVVDENQIPVITLAGTNPRGLLAIMLKGEAQ
jgi:type VI secretion system protein ImpM